jgi:eukaryotic-like serine/threonine-protein kinase
LRKAVAAGWREVASAQADADLDSIRTRADFQNLLMDLAIPANPFAAPEQKAR